MTDDIRALLEATPFEPFTVHMPHGGDYDIDRPEHARLSPHGTLYVRSPTGEVRAILSLDHVVGVSFPARPIIREG